MGNVQHIDGDPCNMAWRNLRLATNSQRAAGQRLSVRNTSGFKGVTWRKRQQAWCAAIKHDGRSHHLGYFTNPTDAAAAYDAAAVQFFGSYAKTNSQ